MRASMDDQPCASMEPSASKLHDPWLRASELPFSWPSYHSWEVCDRLECSVSRRSHQESSSPSHRPRTSACRSQDHSSQDLPVRNRSDAAIFPSASVQETELVRECLYALQGVPAALNRLAKLSKAYAFQPADRSSHRTPTLWQRSMSTRSLGKLLTQIVHSGRLRCHIQEFVDYFLKPLQNGDIPLYENTTQGKKLKKKKSKKIRAGSTNAETNGSHPGGEGSRKNLIPPFSLVNQAFAVAVRSILQGHLAAFNTLTASVSHRRLNTATCLLENSSSGELDAGPIIGLGCEKMTLLELYLHTNELRLHVQVLAAICFVRDIHDECMMENRYGIGKFAADQISKNLRNFPKGADLLTYLYRQLAVADPLHVEILRFLFASAYQPYSNFVRSWIYQATVDDYYNEFVVNPLHDTGSYDLSKMKNKLSVKNLMVFEGSSVPCFLRNIYRPLLQAGQQLQVLLKLAETGEFSRVTGSCYSKGDMVSAILNDILSCWVDALSDCSMFAPILVFRKKELEELMKGRERKNQELLGKFDRLFGLLNVQSYTENVTEQIVCQKHLNQRRSKRVIPKKPSNLACTVINSHEPVKDFASISFSDTSNNASEHEHQQMFSFISHYGMRTSWQKFGLPSNPFMQYGMIDHMPSHRYIFPKFDEVDSSWELNYKIINEESHYASSEISPNIENNHISSEYACLSKFFKSGGPGKLFGILSTREFRQKYGCVESNGFQTERISKMFPSYDLLSGDAWNLDTPILGKSLNMQLLNFDFFSNPGMDTIYSEPVKDPQFGPKYSSNLTEKMIILSEDEDREHTYAIQDHMLPHLTSFRGENNKSTLNEGEADNSTSNKIQYLVHTNEKKCCGGARWQTYLKNIENKEDAGLDRLSEDLIDKADIPLEIVVDECILQEILLQYESVSCATVRLLHEAFGLENHLAALRRYFFMEAGDWADAFITVLCENMVRCIVKPEQRQLEVQAMLEMALQRSCYYGDEYSEKLQVQIGGTRTIGCELDESPLLCINDFTTAFPDMNFVQAFDFILMDYKVEWPINLIVGAESLKIYNVVFSFLLRIKLAVYALGDVWRCLKGLERLFSNGYEADVVKRLREQLRMLTFFRQQISHFITTLQHYIQSQVLHQLWSRFLHSIHFEVKDMQDLKDMHTTYLHDVMNQCFLSEDLKPVKGCIDETMQCLLDFRRLVCHTSNAEGVHINMCSDEFYSAVLEIESRYQKNLQQMYQHYLHSGKQSQKSLGCFWMFLDFNGFLAHVCSDNHSNRGYCCTNMIK